MKYGRCYYCHPIFEGLFTDPVYLDNRIIFTRNLEVLWLRDKVCATSFLLFLFQTRNVDDDDDESNLVVVMHSLHLLYHDYHPILHNNINVIAMQEYVQKRRFFTISYRAQRERCGLKLTWNFQYVYIFKIYFLSTTWVHKCSAIIIMIIKSGRKRNHNYSYDNNLIKWQCSRQNLHVSGIP